LLSALLDIQRNPEGVFMGLLGGEPIEKWMVDGEGIGMSDDEDTDQDGPVESHCTSLKRSQDAVSSPTDGNNSKKMRVEQSDAQATSTTDDTATELQALRALVENQGEQIKPLTKRQTEADERHKNRVKVDNQMANELSATDLQQQETINRLEAKVEALSDIHHRINILDDKAGGPSRSSQ
jgi:hypothetical protein